ncbi:MAG: TonB-dependent receptor [Reichenbachiella sp.]
MTPPYQLSYKLLFASLLLLWHTTTTTAQEANDENTEYLFNDLMELSLEEMLNFKVNIGNLSSLERKNIPFAITTITQDQIQFSQARNIASLLEIYVPGMMLMTHGEGEKIGIRGHIAAENYKLLLLLNGNNITNMVYEGVITEIDLWDLNDIERIEVIRGAGSVTYGTGAVAGVINIITKSYDTAKSNIQVGTSYDYQYRSYGANLHFAKKIKDVEIFTYGSIRRTLGQENPNYYQMNGDTLNDNRYKGKSPQSTIPPQDYLADGLDRPQIKLHTDVRIKDVFKITARYTQSGQTHHMSTKTPTLDDAGNIINTSNGRNVGIRSFSLFPQLDLKLSDAIDLQIKLGYDDQEYIRYNYKNTDFPIDHYNNIKDYAFSQKRATFQGLLNFHGSDKIQLTMGPEITYTWVKQPWGMSSDYLLIREGGYIINDSTTNIYFNDDASQYDHRKEVEEAGNSVFVANYAFLLESSINLFGKTSLLLSARLDKPNISKLMFSPRASFISEINDKNSLRLTIQSSNRMMPLRAQYIYHANKEDDQDYQVEEVNGIELTYTRIQNKDLSFQANVFYDNINAVGFTGKELVPIGEQKQIGVELEAKYRKEKLELGFNHGYLKLIDFDFNEELKTGDNRNNITFSDYYYNIDRDGINLLLTDYGNDLNNWANHSTRLFGTGYLFDKKLVLHANTRVFWGQTGSYDEMRMYEQAYQAVDYSTLTPEETQNYQAHWRQLQNEKRLLEDENAYGIDFKLNASISYQWIVPNKFKLISTVYADNLIGSQKRYYVSTGSTRPLPNRLQFIEEPRTLGIKVNLLLL